MDPIEAMVNQHHDNKRVSARNRYFRKHTKRIFISAAVAAAGLLFSWVGLVHPVLAIPLMVIALMWGCYNLGRCARFCMRVR